MGSQTLEILRQGFWASFTGGWFFDPHQEIFCNTFHMYLWLYLLLLPFVLYLTTEASQITMAVYPAVIFTTFIIIKFISYKLHVMFDGEEIREDDKGRPDPSDGKSDFLDSSEKKRDGEKSEDIEMNDLKTTTPENEPTDGVKIVDTKLESDPGTPTITQPNINEEVVDGKDSSGSEDSTSSLNSNVGRSEVVVVDVHKNREEAKEGYDAISYVDIAEESVLQAESHAPAELQDVIANGEVIENRLVLSELEMPSTPSTAVRTPSPFPFSLWRLMESSSESSWSSSTLSSSNAVQDIKDISYLPVLPRNGGLSDSIGVKSENALVTSSKANTPSVLNGESQEKAVSLSALESAPGSSQEPINRLVANGGARPKTNQGVWFSLPEMEKSKAQMDATHHEDAADSSTDLASGESSQWSASLKHLSDIISEGITEEEEGENKVKTEEVKADSDSEVTRDYVEELLDSLERRSIRRRGAIRQSFRDALRERASLRQRRQRIPSESAGSSLLAQDEELSDNMTSLMKRHVAMTHDDTTAGAVHCFQDEFGTWHTYMFGDDALDINPVSQPIVDSSISSSALLRDLLRSSSRRGAESASTSASLVERDLLESMYRDMRLSQLLSGNVPSRSSTGHSQFPSPGALNIQVTEPVPRRYYKLPVFGSYFVKVWFDRLALLALLDRSKSTKETIAAIVLGSLTAFLGFLLLSRGYFYDFWIFLICFVIAKCQFSLLKSVQPDSASPVHGHNNIIILSRATYFCLVASLIIILDEAAKSNPISHTVYGVHLYSSASLEFAKDLLIGFLLAFPLLFLFGLLPQINTFAMYALEQLDIHIFGGSAMTSLVGSLYAFIRSILGVGFLYGFCYVSLVSKSREQNVIYSVFCGLLVAVSYHLSRCTSDPSILWELFKYNLMKRQLPKDEEEDLDPLPRKLRATVVSRLCNDIIICFGIVIVVFAVHVSTAFTVLQPALSDVLYSITGIIGVVNYYLIPQFRKQLPWLLISSPVLKSHEYHLFEAREPARITWFERVFVWLCAVERNVLYPVTFLSAITRYAGAISLKFGPGLGAVIITTTGLKLLRGSFSCPQRQHIILIWTVLFFQFDYRGKSETFPIDYFVMAILVDKGLDLLLKFRFILTYTAPWQITWGSAFHAFAQPFSVPHCGMLFLQAVVSAFFSAPLNPFLGSAIFITSYVRPIKFWEKNYNTKRVDHSNTRLSSHIDSNPGSDDNNLNSIFYEHLTRSLQHSLCGDLLMGRWGTFSSGDCFVMASDYLNALVHIIEVGNGFVTFQLRGLEFRGTYCQQREVEAITESVEDDTGCCCFHPGHFSHMLSLNAAFNQRWLAWEVSQSKYVLEGYSVSDNTATSMFQVFDLRKIFITYYVKAIVFYATKSPKIIRWLTDDNLMDQLAELKKASFVDLDATFRPMTDDDYDVRFGGVSRAKFCSTYLEWIHHCCAQRKQPIEDCGKDSNLVTLCFALSLLGRRLFSTASHQQTASLKSFLHGLHGLFKGDFRVTSSKDEWVFAEPDMELLQKVIAPAVRMSVKLHQDHFTCPDEYDDNEVLFEAIASHEENLVISHEGHPIWRQAVLHNKPSLLALRYVIDEGTDDYKIIMLNRRHLSFRVIKVNKECVRGLWAGQLQELIFLRNRNPERGSIQNAKQALRNMINSSCDQPIGYPIYVSPLTTSFADTNPQLTQVIGGPVSLRGVRGFFGRMYHRLRQRYVGSCHPRSGMETDPDERPYAAVASAPGSSLRSDTPRSAKVPSNQLNRASSVRASYSAVPNTSRRSSSIVSGAISIGQPATGPQAHLRARISDTSRILDSLNVRNAVELEWPSNEIRDKAGRNAWGEWNPEENQEGEIIHRWEPSHSDPMYRSHIDKPVLLLKIKENIVPIVESGTTLLSEVDV